jgi:hypothetical protein
MKVNTAAGAHCYNQPGAMTTQPQWLKCTLHTEFEYSIHHPLKRKLNH